VTGNSSYTDGGGGREVENSYNEGGVDGAEAAGPFRDSVPRSRHVANLLINPHSAIRRQTCKVSNYENTKRMKYMVGEKWWGLEEESPGATTSLVAHPPLLDEGEGKLSPPNVSNTLSALNEGGGTDLSGLSPPTLECTGGEVSSADTPPIEGAETDLSGLNPPKLDSTGGGSWARTPHNIESKTSVAERPSSQDNRCELSGRITRGRTNSPIHVPLSWSIRGKCVLPDWHCIIRQPRSSRSGPSTAALRRPADRGRRQRCRRQSTVGARSEEAIAHFKAEVDEKVKSGQAKMVSWDAIKANPLENLKISPIAAIPHKSKQFQSILDLSFHLRLKQGGGYYCRSTLPR
jgi:hypothetical protein